MKTGYNAELDGERLQNQLEDVRRVMSDNEWRTLQEINAETGHPEASISARLRQLRALGYTVDKRRRYGVGGTWEYRVSQHSAGTSGSKLNEPDNPSPAIVRTPVHNSRPAIVRTPIINGVIQHHKGGGQ